MSTKNLPCKLTDEELRIKAEELARLHNEVPGIKDEQRAAAAGFKKRLGDIDGRMAVLSQEISTKAVIREVRCEERFDWDANVAEMVRTDTGEVVGRRIIEPSERQRKFSVIDADEKRKGKQSKKGASDEAAGT